MSDESVVKDPRIAALLATRDLSKPVAMLNLLKFRDVASYPAGDDEPPRSGQEAYETYADLVRPILGAMCARVLCDGVAWMIGQTGEWDRAFIVRYERGADIAQLGLDSAYRRIIHHRTAALTDSRLLMMQFCGEVER